MFQNIPLSVAVQPLLHVLLHCMMPPTVSLRKGSCWKRNGLKSQMCIPHGFDFSAKVPQLSFVGIFLMWQLLIRENLRFRLWRCWFSQDPQEAVRGSVWFGCLSIVPIVPMVPCVCLCSLGAEQQMGRLAGVGQEMYPGAPAAPGVPGRHVCSGQPSGRHWEHVIVSVARGGVRQNGTPAKLESFSAENYYYFRGRNRAHWTTFLEEPTSHLGTKISLSWKQSPIDCLGTSVTRGIAKGRAIL